MKFILLFGLLIVFCASSHATCRLQDRLNGMSSDWITLKSKCEDRTKKLINKVVAASLKYLAMGAYFSRDTVNRPGFARFFFDAASKERQRAINLIEYLLMRGKLTSDVDKLVELEFPARSTWANGLTAMEDALEMQHHISENIRGVIQKCENSDDYNDYHLVDYLTAEYLDEQFRVQKELADNLSLLGRMMTSRGELGEFLLDK